MPKGQAELNTSLGYWRANATKVVILSAAPRPQQPQRQQQQAGEKIQWLNKKPKYFGDFKEGHGANPASIISSLGPVMTIFMAYLILGEQLTGVQLISTTLVMAGVFVISQHRKT